MVAPESTAFERKLAASPAGATPPAATSAAATSAPAASSAAPFDPAAVSERPVIVQPAVFALAAHARHVPVENRNALAARMAALPLAGCVLLETCHRIELYASDETVLDSVGDIPAGAERLSGHAVVEHVVELAVGLRSTVIAEDQILHQIRTSVEASRSRATLRAPLSRLFDLALRSGRHARSWLPARRPSLADVALDALPGGAALAGRSVLVVGAGEMGYRAAASVVARGARPTVSSRSRDRAGAIAHDLHLTAADFDPGDSAGELDVIIIALRGPWTISSETSRRIAESDAYLIDLSSPPALALELRQRLGSRLVTIDDLARLPSERREGRMMARLARLADDTVAEYRTWLEGEPHRIAARAMAERAGRAAETELARLWQRLPDLPPDERAEIERMTRHLAERLLREPLERLGQDVDGRHERAARELFGL